jgi:hypothetical protein
MMISKAIEVYRIRIDPEGSPPNSLNELLQPPFGGPSLLEGGADSLIDPWGQQYQMRLDIRPDGTDYVLVYTITPDGTMISQYGIGERAMPKW